MSILNYNPFLNICRTAPKRKLRDKIIKSAKEHTCYNCKEIIHKDETCRSIVEIDIKNKFQTYYWCPKCCDAMNKDLSDPTSNSLLMRRCYLNKEKSVNDLNKEYPLRKINTDAYLNELSRIIHWMVVHGLLDISFSYHNAVLLKSAAISNLFISHTHKLIKLGISPILKEKGVNIYELNDCLHIALDSSDLITKAKEAANAYEVHVNNILNEFNKNPYTVLTISINNEYEKKELMKKLSILSKDKFSYVDSPSMNGKLIIEVTLYEEISLNEEIEDRRRL